MATKLATNKYQIQQVTNASGDYNVLHPETDADVVSYSKTIGGTAVTTVKGALDKIADGIGVTGVKGNAESSYRTGLVNITPANVGAVAANSAITGATHTKITYDSKGLVTSGADLAASDIPSLAASKITSGTFDAARIPTLAQSKISGLESSIQTLTEVANGRAKAYVINYANSTLKNQSNQTITITSSTTSISALSLTNSTFKTFDVSSDSYATIPTPTFKVGDVLYLTDINLPDFWCSYASSNYCEFDILETAKPNLSGYVPTTRTINSKALSSNVTLSGSDIEYAGSDGTYAFAGYTLDETISAMDSAVDGAVTNAQQAAADASSAYSKATTIEGDYVPKARTVNGKALSSNITLGGGDIIYTGNSEKYITVGDTINYALQSLDDTIDTFYSEKADKVSMTSGTYSAVTVNSQGIVTAGGVMIAVGETTSSTAPSNLAIGGIFFKRLS